MGNMDILHSLGWTFRKRCAERQLLLAILALFSVGDVFAFEWRLRPNLSMSEIFSDNLNLNNKDQKGGFVTEVVPGLSLYGQSPWSNFNLNYRLQGLYNAGGGEAFDVNHQLNMNTRYQMIRNTLFVDSSSSISQQNLSNAFIATDNISGPDNRTETKTFNISPYWTPRFGSFATGLLRLGYSRVSFDNSQSGFQRSNLPASLNDFALITDTETYTKQANLSSGRYFNTISWQFGYSATDNNRASGNDANFESYNGDIRYYFNQKFNIFAQGGYANNQFQSVTNSSKNGLYYTFGGQWRPSRFYSIEAGAGNNQHVTLQFNPSANLTSTITYMNKDVGLNRGSSWNAAFNYKLSQATWGFTYSQDTTTVQQLLMDRLSILKDPLGNPIGQFPIDPSTGRPIIDISQLSPEQMKLVFNPYNSFDLYSLPNLVDDVVVTKRGNLSFGYQTGKSHFNANAFNERRTYQQSALQDNVYGISGGWQWQMAPRLSFFLQPMWQSTSGLADNTRYDVALGLNRPFPINLGRPLVANTRLEFRHIEQVSDSSDFDYTENRATANFAVQF